MSREIAEMAISRTINFYAANGTLRYRNENVIYYILSRYVTLIRNCLKNRSIASPKLYLKYFRWPEHTEKVNFFSCHPLVVTSWLGHII